MFVKYNLDKISLAKLYEFLNTGYAKIEGFLYI